MLVYEGGTGRNTVEVDNKSTQFFQIRGVDENSTKAIEVLPIAASLNSNDVFMLNSQQFGSKVLNLYDVDDYYLSSAIH